MTSYEQWSLVVQCSTAVLLLATVIYAAYQIRINTKIHEQNHMWNRRYAAMLAIREAAKGPAGPIDQKFETTRRKQRIPIHEIDKAIAEDASTRGHIHAFLNTYEYLANGVHREVFDEQVIKKARRKAMMNALDNFWEYVENRRQTVNYRAWCELESLVNDWKKTETKAERDERTGNG